MDIAFKELIRISTIEIEGKSGFELRYYLTGKKSESLFACECTEGTVYGIVVELVSSLGTYNGGYCDRAVDPGFSYLKTEALDFINEIADCDVTPVAFFSIVDEYAGIF